jgi:hypothetical protein
MNEILPINRGKASVQITIPQSKFQLPLEFKIKRERRMSIVLISAITYRKKANEDESESILTTIMK